MIEIRVIQSGMSHSRATWSAVRENQSADIQPPEQSGLRAQIMVGIDMSKKGCLRTRLGAVHQYAARLRPRDQWP